MHTGISSAQIYGPQTLVFKGADNTINAEGYCGTLRILHTVIKRKYSTMLIIGVCVISPIPMWPTLSRTCCKMFGHLLYSLGLSLCDFHMFSPLKYSGKALYILVGNKHQECSGLVVLEQQPSLFFVEGIHQLVYDYDVYLSAQQHCI